MLYLRTLATLSSSLTMPNSSTSSGTTTIELRVTYFHQAMQADPLDSTILGRFASFLWLGRGNRAAAERAYKAAMAADPESSFPAGNYAHFLWHAGDGDSCGPSGAMAI